MPRKNSSSSQARPVYTKRVRRPLRWPRNRPSPDPAQFKGCASLPPLPDKVPTKNAKHRPDGVRLPKNLVIARRQLILDRYAAGRSTIQIAIELKMAPKHVTRELNVAIQEAVDIFSKPTSQQSFVRYAGFQMQVVRKLEDVIKSLQKDDKSRQYSAWVSALRAQSDIYDKVYSKGESFGVINSNKADPTALRSTDIRTELYAEVTQLTRLMEQVSDADQRRALRTRLSQTTFAVRVRNPIRTSYGVARAIPDWKYRTVVYDKVHRNVVPASRLTKEQLQTIAPIDPDNPVHQRALKVQEEAKKKTTETTRKGLVRKQGQEYFVSPRTL